MFKILIIEDNKSSAKSMKRIIKSAGYDVYSSDDAGKALEELESKIVDLIITNASLPGMNGYEFTQLIRKNGNNIPVIMVSDSTLIDDKIKGFLAGADDYMIKPLNEQEFILRIKALFRLANIANEQRLHIGETTLDYTSLTVSRGDISVELPNKEFLLLFKLLSYPGQIFTRAQLMDEIWGMDSNSIDATVNVHINRLRKKFGSYPEFEIVTIKGVGYKAVINL